MTFLNKNISVIIPVYNAAPFIERAVTSALTLDEVGEILLIEDGSEDNSLELCIQLSDKYKKIKLLTHANNENKGAGESRNLGIKNASHDYIAFLDADDYFLPNRFEAERSVFQENREVKGVYGAMGYHYYSEEGRKKYKDCGYPEITTMSGRVPPEELFFSLVHVHDKFWGQFPLNTLTVKRSLFPDETELFNNYTMHEDTAFLVQLSLNCRIEPGIIDRPVAMCGVHDNNRIVNNSKNSGSQVLYWKYLYDWSLKSKKGRRFSKLFQAYLMREKLIMSHQFPGILKLIWYSMTNKLFLKKDVFFYPAAGHVLGKRTGPYLLNYKRRIQMHLFKDHPYSSIMDEYINRKH